MLKIETHKGESKISAAGDIHQICAEMLVSFRSVWKAVRETDQELADTFVRTVSAAFEKKEVFEETAEQKEKYGKE